MYQYKNNNNMIRTVPPDVSFPTLTLKRALSECEKDQRLLLPLVSFSIWHLKGKQTSTYYIMCVASFMSHSNVLLSSQYGPISSEL